MHACVRTKYNMALFIFPLVSLPAGQAINKQAQVLTDNMCAY